MQGLSNLLSGSAKKERQTAFSDELDNNSHMRPTSAGVIADEPDSFLTCDWRAEGNRSPLPEYHAPTISLGAPLSAEKKKDYYAGSVEIAIETPLTVTRLEPVCSRA